MIIAMGFAVRGNFCYSKKTRTITLFPGLELEDPAASTLFPGSTENLILDIPTWKTLLLVTSPTEQDCFHLHQLVQMSQDFNQLPRGQARIMTPSVTKQFLRKWTRDMMTSACHPKQMMKKKQLQEMYSTALPQFLESLEWQSSETQLPPSWMADSQAWIIP